MQKRDDYIRYIRLELMPYGQYSCIFVSGSTH